MIYRKEFDILLKDILKKPPVRFIQILTGKKPSKLLNTELLWNINRKADFIIELEDNSILHLEFQSYNDINMPKRMLEYLMLIFDKYKTENIYQVCIYVGNDKITMKDSIKFPSFTYSYKIMDMREINCKELIFSKNIEDKLLAALCNIEDPVFYVEHMKEILEQLPRREREEKAALLIEIMKLRDIIKEGLIKSQEEKMPIRVTIDLDEIVNDPWLGEIAKMAIKKGEEYGIQIGMEKGLQQGLQQGLRESIYELLYDKFGEVPVYYKEKIEKIDDTNILRDILKLVSKVQDMESFKRHLENIKI